MATGGVTAAVIAQNEAAHIEECLASLSWADARLVLDGGSRDDTILRCGAASVLQRPFDSFARQRNYALEHVETEWVLFVDADERVQDGLAREIREAVTGAPAGYWVPRKNMMLGRWVRHAGWWPDYQLRLFRRGAGRYDESRDPHEVLDLKGPSGYLKEPLLHYNYGSIGEMFARQERYARREARTLAARGAKPRLKSYLSRPAREFWRRYVGLEGYKEGALGVLLGLVMAWYEYRVLVHLSHG